MENGKKITRFYMEPQQLGKWMYQNDAEYTGMFIEGCLLDNFVVMTRRGFAAVYEHYVNPNQSNYYIEFQPGAAQDVLRKWYELEDAAFEQEVRA